MAEAKAKSKEKFLELGTYRVNKAIARIKQIGNLSAYEYDDEHAKQMFEALFAAVKAAEARFDRKTKTKEGFTFGEKE